VQISSRRTESKSPEVSLYQEEHETATKHDDVVGELELDNVQTAGKHDLFEQTPVSPEKPTSQLLIDLSSEGLFCVLVAIDQ